MIARVNRKPFEPAFPVAPDSYFRVMDLPAGAVAGPTAYVPFEVSSDGVLSLEQFDAQPPGVPMFGYAAGWFEPEYSPETGRAWRWTSDKSELWVRPIGRPVTLHLSGESPLRYYGTAPHVRVLIGTTGSGRVRSVIRLRSGDHLASRPARRRERPRDAGELEVLRAGRCRRGSETAGSWH